MRVVGYIREASADDEPAFAQSEQIRRWIVENGHRLVALCQDVRTPGHAVGREGLQIPPEARIDGRVRAREDQTGQVLKGTTIDYAERLEAVWGEIL